jgi:chloramphenicol 3-O-phosphotransferase
MIGRIVVRMYTVEAGAAVGGVPEHTRTSLAATLQEIAATIAALPDTSAFWRSVRGERLHLDLAGWRFWYVVEPDVRRVSVVQSSPLAVRPQ